MPYELFLALRYLRARQKRRLVRATALIAVVGIAVGVAALMFTLSLAHGFRDEMRDKILGGTAHLTVMRNDGQAIADHKSVAARIATIDGVIEATGTTYDGAVVIGPKGGAYAVLRGLDDSASAAVAALDKSMIAGDAATLFETNPDPATGNRKRPQVLLGSELAARTGLQNGDVAEVVSAAAGWGSSTQRSFRIQVVGVFRSGLFEYDSTWAYISLDRAPDFTSGRHVASVISVRLRDMDAVKETAAKVQQLLGNSYTSVDWQEANRPLFAALALESRVGAIIIGLIILIAALNITTTLILVVTERRRDIAVLNTLGATGRSIMSVFVIEGAVVGLVGAAAGVLLGVVAILTANRYQLVSLPADVYSISNVPLSLNLRDAVLAAAVAILLSVIATLYPALAAARIRPAEMLRDAG
ncbi:MAG TPA: ABC transporter permease [Pyrinomonadaceae bacterium]|nr:ABC transporter permease [Pyrinomonadaceae bacterium]